MTTYALDSDGNIIAPADFISRFGVEMPVAAVPALVRAGFEVWSYGYGQEDNEDPGTFTVLDPTDFWFDQPTPDDLDELDVAWGPFAVSREDFFIEKGA